MLVTGPARPHPGAEFAEHVRDLLHRVGAVSVRRMFGGHGIYCDGTMFALIADDMLYFKVDDSNRPRYAALGLQPFKPFADRPTVMSYYPVPFEVLEDPDEVFIWATEAFQVARRAAAAKAAKKPRRRVNPTSA